MTNALIASSPAIDIIIAKHQRRGGRILAAGVVGTFVVATFVGGMGATAFAAPGGTVPVNVDVDTAITLTFQPVGETLNLAATIPGVVVGGAVAYTVATNSNTGYNVTVAANATNLVGTGANTEFIPFADLLVTPDVSTGAVVPLALTVAPQVIYRQATRSADAGDPLGNAYSITIPLVNSDTYSGTLIYLAAANA